MSDHKKEPNDFGAIIALCGLFIYNPLIVVGSVIFNNFIPSFSKIDMELYLIILFSIFIWAIFLKKVEIEKDMLIFPLFMLVLWGISYTFFPVNKPYLLMLFFYLISQTLPAYFFTRAVKRFDLLFIYFVNISRFIIVFALISVFIKATQDKFLEYNMVFSYVILFPTLILMSSSLYKNNKTSLLFAITGIGIILINGSRGSSLCVIVFLFIFSFFNLNKRISRYLIFLSILTSIFVMSDSFYTSIGDFTILLQKYQIKSRTLDKLVMNQIGWDNGRLRFIYTSLDIIKDSPIVGMGMAGDRISIANRFHSTHVSYSHNLFIELVLQYGFFAGSVMIFTLFFLAFYGLVKCKDRNLNIFVQIMIPLVFVKLMISSTYIAEIPFFMFIAFCFNSICLKKSTLHLTEIESDFNKFTEKF